MTDKKKLFIKSYGCQMNVYDSQRMLELMANAGYQSTSDPTTADLILLNTCHIREKAAEKVYSELGRYKTFKEQNSELQIGVAGCVAQAEGEEIVKRQPLVDFVVGPQAYHQIPNMVKNLKNGRKEINTDFPAEDKFEFLPRRPKKSIKPAAFLTVQEGCDKFCAFCVVPYTRGTEVSRSPDSVILEAENLVDSGVVEITLLGQNVNAYRVEQNGSVWTLATLIKELAKISQLHRIRFTTSHPNDMSRDLMNLFGDEEKLMPYLHLPIQSGSNNILKAMNRRHTVSQYLDVINRLRIIRPDIAVSGDFIVGFPGETLSDFKDTLNLCEQVRYAQAFSFKYSRRIGTPAAERPEVSENEKLSRLHQLQSVLTLHQKDFHRKMIGNEYPVLIERRGKETGQVVGKTPYSQPVFVKESIDKIGKILPVRIHSSHTNSLQGISCHQHRY